MIPVQTVESLLLQQDFTPLRIELFIQMYADLPYPDRQKIAALLTDDPGMAHLAYDLLKNKRSFETSEVKPEEYIKKEASLITGYLGAN